MNILFLLILSLSIVTLAQAKVRVVTSFTILADFVQQVGQDKVDVLNLVSADSDPHMYEPTPQDVKNIAKADIIFINGLGFEGWLGRLTKAANTKGDVVVCTEHIHPRLVFEDTLLKDPHAWHSIPHAKIYVQNIARALKKKDPSNKAFYEKNMRTYLEKLTQLDESMRRRIDHIPPNRRKIITAHDAFGYFGNSYGVQVFAPQGVSTESETKIHSIIDLVKQIKQEKIRIIFIEKISNPKVIQQISDETGAQIGGELYADGLSATDGPANSYINMVRYNFNLILNSMIEND